MPIVRIHGNGGLVGAAFQGLGEGAAAFTDARNQDRALDDREERTKAYVQRLQDAQKLKQEEFEYEKELANLAETQEKIKRQTVQAMAGARVQGMESSPFWTKDDEVGLRTMHRELTEAGTPADEIEKSLDTYLDAIALRNEQQQAELERMKVRDRIMRGAQPDATGLARLDEETVGDYEERLESGEPISTISRDLNRDLRAGTSKRRTEREMAEAASIIEQARSIEGVNDTQRDMLDEIEFMLDLGPEDGGITPGQARFQARSVMNGEGEQLKEFAALVARAAQRQSAPEPEPFAPGDLIGAAAPAGAEVPEGVSAGPEALTGGARRLMAELRGESKKARAEKLQAYADENGVAMEDLLAALAEESQGKVPEPGMDGVQTAELPEGRASEILRAPSTRGSGMNRRATKDDLITRIP